jgi:hypothetical protein
MRATSRNPVSAPKALIASLAIATGVAFAADPVATVTHSSGTVSVKRGSDPSKLLAVKSEVFEGDRISTEADTYTRLKFKDGSEVVLRPNTQMVVANYAYREEKPEADNALLNLIKGGLRSVTGLLGKRNKDKFGVTTPTATIGIRGTNFGLLLCNSDCGGIPTVTGKPLENGLHIDVADGAVIASNKGGNLQFNVGQFGFVKDANTPPVLVPPANGVRVTIPGSIRNPDAAGKSVGKGGGDSCSF